MDGTDTKIYERRISQGLTVPDPMHESRESEIPSFESKIDLTLDELEQAYGFFADLPTYQNIHRTKEGLFNQLEESGILKSPHIRKAFEQLDRSNFTHPNTRTLAHNNIPLPIGLDQTISQPFTVAAMMAMAVLRPRQIVMEVGAGSGCTAALLSLAVQPGGSVVATEIRPKLFGLARENLDKSGLGEQVSVVLSEKGVLGIPGRKFDRIIVSAQTTELPLELVHQLSPGGIMVIPMNQALVRVVMGPDGKDYKINGELPGFTFVDLVG